MIRSALFSLLVLASPLPLRAAAPLLAPPPVVQRQGQPMLGGGALCPALQTALESAVGPEERVWSVSVLDQRGQLLADLNGGTPRVPASNQKLVSTAFALDRLGPDFRLRTQLLRHADGTLEIMGEGDPDLTIAEIQKFAMVALGQGGSRTPASLTAAPVQLMVREEPRQRWWPADWEPADRSYAYGAPITRLALTSNALHMAVMDPAARLQRILNSTINQQGGQIRLKMVDQQTREAALAASEESSVVLHSEDSAPMHAP